MIISESKIPSIVITPSISLIDSPVEINIVGIEPGQEVVIRAQRVVEGKKNIYLSSYATFIGNDEGKIELNSQAPINGTYSCVDGMGLFWSLEVTKVEEGTNTSLVSTPVAPQTVTFSLEIENSIVTETKITRLWKAENITRTPIREKGIIGTFFCQEDGHPLPPIIVLGGSEGGINEYMASLLASHGFAVLALAYFGMEGLPKRAVNVPLEYIEAAIDWVKNRLEVKPGWLGIHGTSKGSELALLSASLFPDIKAVVSLNGSAIAFSGIVPWTDEEFLPPAWIYNGKAFPYASPKNPIDVALECLEMQKNGQGNPLSKWYNALAANPEVVEKAVIPVERINGDILLISGEEDITLPFAEIAMERLKNNKFVFSYKHLVYPKAEHSIGVPYVFYNQGNKKYTAAASLDSWRKTIDFYFRSVVR